MDEIKTSRDSRLRTARRSHSVGKLRNREAEGCRNDGRAKAEKCEARTAGEEKKKARRKRQMIEGKRS